MGIRQGTVMQPRSDYFHQHKHWQQVCPPSLQCQQLTTQTWDQFMSSTVVNDHAGARNTRKMTASSGLTYHLPECENEISQFCCMVCTSRIKQQLPTDNRNYSHWRLNTWFSFAPSSGDWQITEWQEKVSPPTFPALWKSEQAETHSKSPKRSQSINI